MTEVIECVPNISEGRDSDIISYIADKARSVPGVSLLDVNSDADHNRSVFTMAGCAAGIIDAAFAVAKAAAERIDLTKHSGEHPRMGAVDVIPFIPLRNTSMEMCVDVSNKAARRIADELGIPVFLYEASATDERRRNLADIRRGGFEGMPAKLLKKGWEPDYGARQVHPTAGVVAVGARMPLIAFNVNLNTSDITIANAIAKAVRGSSGGLRYCKAIGVKLHDRQTAQVSMNLVNHEKTPIYRVFELIRAEAERYGVSVSGSELIGLAPAKALIDCAEYYLRLEGFDYRRQVLENHLY